MLEWKRNKDTSVITIPLPEYWYSASVRTGWGRTVNRDLHSGFPIHSKSLGLPLVYPCKILAHNGIKIGGLKVCYYVEVDAILETKVTTRNDTQETTKVGQR